MTYVVPPQGLDFSSASAAELAEYGIPPAPSDPSALSDWQDMIAHLHLVTPPPSLAATSITNVTNPSNVWSGYEAYSSSSTAYNLVEGQYNEPQALSTPCAGNAATTWAGLGGDGSQDLAQDGTAINAPGLGQHQAWSEVLPDQPYSIAQPLSGHPGWRFYAEVNHISGGFHMYLYDSESGDGTAFTVHSNNYSGKTADFIVERPIVNHAPVPLTNYAYINYIQTYVNNISSSSGVGAYPHSPITMEVSKRDRAVKARCEIHVIRASARLKVGNRAFRSSLYRLLDGRIRSRGSIR